MTDSKLSADVVESELTKISQADWTWEALPHEEDSFLVAFPSDEEMQQMASINYHLKNHGVTITISAWQSSSDVKPTYQLEEIWVHITGVPHACMEALSCLLGFGYSDWHHAGGRYVHL